MRRWRAAVLLGLLGWAGGRTAAVQTYEAALEALLADPAYRGAAVALIVTELFTGAVVLAHRADEPLIPASNMKVVTAAAALEYLGTDATFSTRLRLGGAIRDGVLDGDLILEGDGDPDFGSGDPTASPEGWAGKLADRGVRCVAGNLVLAERRLDQQYAHPDWSEYPAPALYVRVPAALGCGQNLVKVTVLAGAQVGDPGRLEAEPDCGPVELVNRTRTVRGKSAPIWFRRDWESSRMEVHAAIRRGGPPRSAAAAVHDPPLFLGRCFAAALRQAGIAVEGEIVRDAAVRPPDGPVVAEHRTPIAAMLRACLKTSDNRIAEILCKATGAAYLGEIGSFAAGGRAAAKLLERAGADPAGAACRDGSGLSRANRLTARQLAALLAWVSGRPYAAMFSDALPAGGEDGTTLRRRFGEAPLKDCVRAKTGYLGGVRALSGYLRVGPDRVLVFAVLVNAKAGAAAPALKPLDELVRSLWRSGRRSSRPPGR
ncbi:MAG: D-alanyl-D-alanine carboxypeptidase/D-alanyl-D-alanine-endopeptidase [Planctomycetes bacterium]|nr:D-alanyl-D-alanine carboxypeptidase/D-alanyl-D-alanine-endopeptidase [Planctomycetota bacterium]